MKPAGSAPPGVGVDRVIVPERFAPGMARQLERFREALAGGMPRRGWKVGINVPELLGRLGLPHPAVGWLDGCRVFPAGAELRARPGARLHAEPELAIRVSRAVPPGSSAEVARGCIAAVHPALEIVDYAKPTAGLDDLVGHCMFHDATVLGLPAALDAAYEPGALAPRIRAGDRASDPPRADLVPADLGELLAFVARYLAAFRQALEPGDIVLSGSWTARAVEIRAGDTAVAEFGALGEVSVRVAA